MAALRILESLAIFVAAIVTILRARPAAPPYGRRMAWIALLLALELGLLLAFLAFAARTNWGSAAEHVMGVAFATQALRAVLLFAAASACFAVVLPEVRGGWGFVLAAGCASALAWGRGSLPVLATVVLAVAFWRMKWIEDVRGWRRPVALAGSAALLVALSVFPPATAPGSAMRLLSSSVVHAWPPPLLTGELSRTAASELQLVRPLDRAVQAITDLFRILLVVVTFKLVFLPIRLTGTDLKRRFRINFILVHTIPGVLAALTLAGVTYLGLGAFRLDQVRGGFERTLTRAGTVAAALAADPAALRGVAPEPGRLAAAARWMGPDSARARVRWIASGEAVTGSPAESVFTSGLVVTGDSLVLVARRSAAMGARVEVSVPLDADYLARILQPVGGSLVVSSRPNLLVGPARVRVIGDSTRALHAVIVSARDSAGVARHERSWYLGRTFVPIGDWARGHAAYRAPVAELDLSTTARSLVLGLFHSLGGLYPYLGILFAFGVLFSILETIAVRSGRSIVEAVVDEAVLLRTAAERLGAGDLDYRVPVRGKDEFGVVAASFNQMAANLKHQREELLEAERVEEELAVAMRIQQRFLPQRAPELRDLDVAGISLPSREVGGDLYDWFPHEDGKLGFVLGDVAGKSVPAAMLMSNVLASLRAYAEMRVDLAETLGRVNRFIAAQVEPGRFVTLFYAEADPARGTLRYACAGHNPPLLVRADGRSEWLREGGVPLGIMPDSAYTAATVAFAPGDTLVAYSDGITEAFASAPAAPGAEPPMYGEERLEQVARSHRGAAAGAMLEALMASVREFAKGAPQADDITLAIVRHAPPGDRD